VVVECGNSLYRPSLSGTLLAKMHLCQKYVKFGVHSCWHLQIRETMPNKSYFRLQIQIAGVHHRLLGVKITYGRHSAT